MPAVAGRQQDSGPEVAGGEDQAGQLRRADDWRIVGSSRPQPGDRLGQLKLGDAGHQRARVAQQFPDAACRHPGIGAKLLLGGADHQLAAVPGYQVDRRATDNAPDRPFEQAGLPGGICGWCRPQPQYLALHRAHRRCDPVRQPGDGARLPAGREHYKAGQDAGSVGQHGAFGTSAAGLSAAAGTVRR